MAGGRAAGPGPAEASPEGPARAADRESSRAPGGHGACRRLFGPRELAVTVARLGGELDAAYPNGVLLVGVLKGSVPFLADLARTLTVAVEVDFLAISAYTEGTGRVRIVKDLDTDIWDRDVVLVEDIVDTGLTATYVLGELRRRGAKSVAVCTLLDKSVRRLVPVPLRFVGFEVGDEFVVGYGMDFAEHYRNLNAVAAVDLDALRADPSAYVDTLYRR